MGILAQISLQPSRDTHTPMEEVEPTIHGAHGAFHGSHGGVGRNNIWSPVTHSPGPNLHEQLSSDEASLQHKHQHQDGERCGMLLVEAAIPNLCEERGAIREPLRRGETTPLMRSSPQQRLQAVATRSPGSASSSDASGPQGAASQAVLAYYEGASLVVVAQDCTPLPPTLANLQQECISDAHPLQWAMYRLQACEVPGDTTLYLHGLFNEVLSLQAVQNVSVKALEPSSPPVLKRGVSIHTATNVLIAGIRVYGEVAITHSVGINIVGTPGQDTFLIRVEGTHPVELALDTAGGTDSIAMVLNATQAHIALNNGRGEHCITSTNTSLEVPCLYAVPSMVALCADLLPLVVVFVVYCIVHMQCIVRSIHAPCRLDCLGS